jgi:hypothetical protein
MRSVLLYLVLVGMPVLGILGLLRVGQKLSAPISLAGPWNAQLSLPSQPDSAAGDSLSDPGPILLNISQSGPNLFLAFDDDQKTTLVGKVQDTTIDASVFRDRRGPTNTSSSATIIIHFHGRVDRQTQRDRLVGVLIFQDGSSRTEVPLSARRQGEVRKAGGGQ